MPALANRKEATDTRLAILAESLYLINLLLLPGIGFVLMFYLRHRLRAGIGPLANNHFSQAISASIWAGVLLLVLNALIIVLGGYHGPYIWMIVILYFTMAHSTLILLGIVALIKAMAGQCWRYPLIGTRRGTDC